jgi:hypothetical protein
MSNRPYYFMQASTLKLNGYKTASKEVIEAISVQIVSILQDIYRKLNGIVRDDELDYIIFQIERIENNSFSMYRRPWRLRGPLSKIHPLVLGRKNRFSSYFAYELDFGQ